MMKLAPQVDTALELLEAAGYEAYLVGGAVRDFVRDNSPAKDWDIATNALPEQVKAVFAGFRLIETGILDQSFETVVFATAVFDIHQHTELILKGNLLEFWVIELVAECICHCGKAHFY